MIFLVYECKHLRDARFGPEGSLVVRSDQQKSRWTWEKNLLEKAESVMMVVFFLLLVVWNMFLLVEILLLEQIRYQLRFYPIIHMVSYIPGGFLSGFLNHEQ